MSARIRGNAFCAKSLPPSPMPPQLQGTLEHIVGQLDLMTNALNLLENRLSVTEDKLGRIEGNSSQAN